jgi:hypothetical protein
VTDPDYTHISIIADRSGSMGADADGSKPPTVAQLTTDGIHLLVRDQQQQPGKLTVSLMHFDTAHEIVEDFGDGSGTLAWRCSPRGATALLDAVGTTIVTTGEKLAALPEGERPGRVIVIIGTDGYENSSCEYTRAQVKEMVERQQKDYGWDFVFQGAGIDAFDEARGIGIARGQTVSVAAADFASAYNSTSQSVARSRARGRRVSYSDEERKQAGSE